MLAIDGLLARPGIARGSALALAVAFCAWGGSPPALWLCSTFAVGYLLVRLGARLRLGGIEAIRPLAGPLALATLLTALLVAVVIIPGMALSGRSVQADHTFASLSAESLDVPQLLAIVSPQPGNHLFLGPVVWLGLGAALSARRTRATALTCLLVGGLAVLVTMGEHGPVFRALFDHVPGFDRFRLPHRYEAWLGPPAALATALGFEVLVRELARAREPKRWLVSSSVCLLLVSAHLVLVTQRLDEQRHSRTGTLPCADSSDVLAQAVADVDARVFDEFALGCRSGTRLGHRDFRGYQDPLMLHGYERVLSRLGERPGLLRQFGVRYALTSPHFLHGWDHHYLPRPEVLASLPGAHTVEADGARRIIDLGEPVPRAYIVSAREIIEVSSREAALERIAVLSPRPVAIVERDGAAPLADEPIFERAPSATVATVTEQRDRGGSAQAV
jgi:hypothetical protein